MKSAESPEQQHSRIINYQAFFDTTEGESVLVDLMAAHFYRTSLSVEHPDPYVMAYREGERNVIIRILSILNVSEKRLGEIIKEQRDGKRSSGRKPRHSR